MRRHHRAAHQRAVVASHGKAARPRRRGQRGRPGSLAPGALRAHLPRLDARPARLEHQPAALARPSHPGLLLRERPRHRERRPTARVHRMRQQPVQAGHRRPRHLVLVGPVAFRHARLARRDRRPADLLPDEHELHGPRKIVDQFGADALRAWAASVAMLSQDVRYDESRVEGYRRFCNKLWNAVKPILTSLDGGEARAVPEPEKLVLYEDRWILSKLAAACDSIARGIEEFAFQDSINAAYAFAWNEFCDWWLEAAKPRLKASDPVAQAIGVYCLDALMRALHPFMPFVT